MLKLILFLLLLTNLYSDEENSFRFSLNIPYGTFSGIEKAIEPEFQLTEHTSFDVTLSYIDYGDYSEVQGYRLGLGYRYYIEPMYTSTNNYFHFHYQNMNIFSNTYYDGFSISNSQSSLNLFTTLLGYQFIYDYLVYNFGVGFAIGVKDLDLFFTPIGQFQIGIIF